MERAKLVAIGIIAFMIAGMFFLAWFVMPKVIEWVMLWL